MTLRHLNSFQCLDRHLLANTVGGWVCPCLLAPQKPNAIPEPDTT